MKLPRQSGDSARGGRAGFTLIEIVIAVAILVALAGLGLIVGIDLYKSNVLGTELDNAVNVLQKARAEAQANIGGSPHGISLQSNRYVIFRGSSYAARDPLYDEEILISPIITATGSSEIVFSQLSGNANASGTITLTDERGVSFVVSVDSEGRIDW